MSEKDKINEIKASVYNKLEDGSLLIFSLGSDEVPATRDDMDRIGELVFELFKDTTGVKVLMLPHLVKVEKIPLEQLKNIESQVIRSWDSKDNNALITDLGDFDPMKGLD